MIKGLVNFTKNLMFDVKRLVILDRFTAKEYGVSDLLLYSRFVDEGIILNTDGSFMTLFWYRGDDLDAATEETLNYLGTIIHNALLPLDTGWSMHLDNVRKESAGYISEDKCYFKDATTYSIDHERRMEYNRESKHYENEYVLTFTYLPPGDTVSKVGAFFLTKDEEHKKIKFDYTIYLEKFKDVLSSVLEVLTSSQFKISKMSDDEILSHLFYCINGIHTNFKAPQRHWTDLRFMLANQDITTGFHPVVGKKHIRVISMGEQFPLETYPALLKGLNNLGFEYRWSTRYIFLSVPDAMKVLKKISDLHYQKRESAASVLAKGHGGGSSKIDRSSVRYADEAEEAKSAIEMSNYRYGKYTSCVVILDEDEELLKEKVKIVEGVINNCGLKAKVEEAHCFEAYLGAVPAMVRPNVRKWVMSSYNLSDLMPTTSVWSGYKYNPNKYYKQLNTDSVLFYASTAGGTPFRGCMHVGDDGHALVIGTNNQIVMNFLAAQQCRHKNAKVYIFDSNHASIALTYGIQSSVHYDIGYGENSISFQPLAFLDTQEDFTFAVDWLAEICVINGFDVKPVHISIINEVLQIIRKEAQKEQRTLSYFYLQMTSKNEELAAQIKPYISSSGDGLQNYLFDADKNRLTLNNFTVFEMEQITRKGDATLIPAILYLFHMIERSLDGSPVSIYIHDGWTIFKHPVFREYLDDWLRKIAALNVQLIIGVAQPSDITNSAIAEILMQTCKTKIYTANLNARGTQKKSYENLGLNFSQIDLIANSVVNRDYYFTSSLGSRLIQFHMGDIAKVFLQCPSIEELEQIRELKATYGDLFGYHWIKQSGLIDEIAEFWLEVHNKYVEQQKLLQGGN
ncbi:MAG: type secretion system protein TrbE [Pseudomonadota bacterium]|nr:type secretion system protein TrbE [Pseudomonadota bacterium]